jgi:hypothetical protein
MTVEETTTAIDIEFALFVRAARRMPGGRGWRKVQGGKRASELSTITAGATSRDTHPITSILAPDATVASTSGSTMNAVLAFAQYSISGVRSCARLYRGSPDSYNTGFASEPRTPGDTTEDTDTCG